MTLLYDPAACPPVIERAIKYGGQAVEHFCQLLRFQNNEVILHHQVKEAFTLHMQTGLLHIPEGSRTFAYYWLDRPYNAYYWLNPDGNYVGTYLNLVRETSYQTSCLPLVLSFHDLILDVVSLPDGTTEVLDEDELPAPLHEFENGTVAMHLAELREGLAGMVSYMAEETSKFLTFP